MEKTIITATDLHYISPLVHGFRSAFLSQMKEEDGKMTILSEEIAVSLTRFVISRKPDAFIITGDLTWNGDLTSHLEIARYLQTIQDAGIPVYIIGGNHDTGRERANHYAPFCTSLPVCASEEQFAEIYSSFLLRDDPVSHSYFAEMGTFRLLMLDANGTSEKGRLSNSTIHWLCDRLDESCTPVFAFSHQNFLSQHPFFKKRRIKNSDKLLSIFRKHGIRAGFSGHSHLQHIAESDDFCDICTSCFSSFGHHAGILHITDRGFDYHTVSVPIYVSDEKKKLLGIRSTEDEMEYFLQSVNRMAGFAKRETYLDRMILSFFSGRMDQFIHCISTDEKILMGIDHPLSELAKTIVTEKRNMNFLYRTM